MSTAESPQADPNRVLAKALFSAQSVLGLNQAQLGQVLGMERTGVSRLKRRGVLDPDTKTGQLAVCLIRIYRSLYTLVGGDESAMRHWISTKNIHLQDAPVNLIGTIQGLVQTMQYLDALRGKV